MLFLSTSQPKTICETDGHGPKWMNMLTCQFEWFRPFRFFPGTCNGSERSESMRTPLRDMTENHRKMVWKVPVLLLCSPRRFVFEPGGDGTCTPKGRSWTQRMSWSSCLASDDSMYIVRWTNQIFIHVPYITHTHTYICIFSRLTSPKSKDNR